MRRILSLLAVVALMLAFAMPVMTADAASHEKAADTGKETMKKSGEEGKEMMKKSEEEGKEMMKKGENQGKEMMPKANPGNPCAPKKQ